MGYFLFFRKVIVLWKNLTLLLPGWNGDGNNVGDGIWTDGMKVGGSWLWSNGEEISGDVWAPGEPNGNGVCLQLYRGMPGPEYSFKMDDSECSNQFEYVCEKLGH